MPPLLMKSASQSGAINHKPPMSEQEFTKNFNIVIKDFFSEPIVEVSFPKLNNNLCLRSDKEIQISRNYQLHAP